MGRKRNSVEGNYRIDLPKWTAKDYCEKCGNNSVLIDTHRKIPGSLGGLYVPENIIFLCKSCHKKEHGRMKKEAEDKQLGFSSDVIVSCKVSEEMKYSLKHLSVSTGMSLQNLLAKVIFDFINDNNHWKRRE